MASIENNFRCDIFWCTAESPCLFPMIQSLSKSKVHDFDLESREDTMSPTDILYFMFIMSISHDTFTI
ncbi:hypothetical protein V1478_016231 [Vespula squamosa]|uniref:Uncharacterized protein n=1 Tax=Vespula squamosa TaxID=30214 RepID=A0ABD1ZZ84_VESSQ